jgi:hypothetical protein
VLRKRKVLVGSWVACGDSVRRSFKRFLDKTLANLSSLKFYAVLLASYLKLEGKLTSEFWFYTVSLCVLSRDTLKMVFSALETVKGIKEITHAPKESAPTTVTNVVNTQDATDGTPK